MTTVTAPRYNIGDKFFIPTTKTEKRRLDCPDCLGEKKFKVIAPSGDEFTMDCPRCNANSYTRDIPSLDFTVYEADVLEREITSYTVNAYGKQGVEYRSQSGHVVEESSLIDNFDAAMAAAKILAADQNEKAAATPERMQKMELGSRKLHEATLDQFKSGLYASWSAFRHLRETVDEIIADESSEYDTRSQIVEALEEKLSSTMRYTFIFEGFTRAMEAVVALAAADEEDVPAIAENLRKQWRALPEAAQKAWTPHDKIATDWSGEPCPTY